MRPVAGFFSSLLRWKRTKPASESSVRRHGTRHWRIGSRLLNCYTRTNGLINDLDHKMLEHGT